MGQWVLPPHPASRALGARRSRFRRDVPQSRCAPSPASPVRTAAVPCRFSRADVLSDVGRNCALGSRAIAAGPAFQAAVPSKVLSGGRKLSTWEVVPTPQPSEPSMVRSLKARGPRCLPPRAWRRSLSLFEAAALGRRRFAPPRRARSRQLCLRWHAIESTVTLARSRCLRPGTRLDAEPSFSYFYREQS